MARSIVAFAEPRALTVPTDADLQQWSASIAAGTDGDRALRGSTFVPTPRADKKTRGSGRSSPGFALPATGTANVEGKAMVGVVSMEEPHTIFLLYLNVETFNGEAGDRLAGELRYILGLPGGGRSSTHPTAKVVMIHERDESAGGCDFDRSTPEPHTLHSSQWTTAPSRIPGRHHRRDRCTARATGSCT